ENVRGLLSAPMFHRPHDRRGEGFAPLSDEELPGGALAHIITALESFGYYVTFNLYNTANFGVPQIRERLVMFASRHGPVPDLVPSHSETEDGGLPKWRTFREAVVGLDAEEPV